MKVKDVIVDCFIKKNFLCLLISKDFVDFYIYVCLYKENVLFGIDMVGLGLYVWGYWIEVGKVLLCEILVVVIILCSGWDVSKLFFDFMCGFGILLIEVVMMVVNIVLGL